MKDGLCNWETITGKLYSMQFRQQWQVNTSGLRTDCLVQSYKDSGTACFVSLPISVLTTESV